MTQSSFRFDVLLYKLAVFTEQRTNNRGRRLDAVVKPLRIPTSLLQGFNGCLSVLLTLLNQSRVSFYGRSTTTSQSTTKVNTLSNSTQLLSSSNRSVNDLTGDVSSNAGSFTTNSCFSARNFGLTQVASLLSHRHKRCQRTCKERSSTSRSCTL